MMQMGVFAVQWRAANVPGAAVCVDADGIRGGFPVEIELGKGNRDAIGYFGKDSGILVCYGALGLRHNSECEYIEKTHDEITPATTAGHDNAEDNTDEESDLTGRSKRIDGEIEMVI